MSTVSPACEVTELEEAVVGGAERDRDARDRDDVGAVGDRPRDDRRDRDQLGVRTPEHRRDDALADVTIGHVGADLADRARALVADDVRRHRQHAAGAVQRVAAFDADRLDLDQDAAGWADGIGDVLVAEDVRRAGLVVHGSLHGRILSAFR